VSWQKRNPAVNEAPHGSLSHWLSVYPPALIFLTEKRGGTLRQPFNNVPIFAATTKVRVAGQQDQPVADGIWTAVVLATLLAAGAAALVLSLIRSDRRPAANLERSAQFPVCATGLMFWFIRKKLVGSYFVLTATSFR
jgi:hypothetical protein